jgi:hypothetical protein
MARVRASSSPPEQIPRRRLLVWKNTTLLAVAQELADQWQRNEPSLNTDRDG